MKILLLHSTCYFSRFFDNHAAKVPSTPNQRKWGYVGRSNFKRKHTRKEHKQVSGVWSGRHWVHQDKLESSMDIIFRQYRGHLFSPSIFNANEVRSMAENPIQIDQEEDKENSSSLSTQVSERPTEPSTFQRSFRFGTSTKSVPGCFYREFFDWFFFLRCMWFCWSF